MKLLPAPRIKYVRLNRSLYVRADHLKRIDEHISEHLDLTVSKLFDVLVKAKALPKSAVWEDWCEVVRLRLRRKRQDHLLKQITKLKKEVRGPNLRHVFRHGSPSLRGLARSVVSSGAGVEAR